MTTAALFERLAVRYDELWTDTAIGRAQRNAVWRVVDGLFRAGDHVLDIGCGTGEDAAHLMARGVRVSAVDASPAMVAQARARGVAAQVMRAEDVGKSLAAMWRRHLCLQRRDSSRRSGVDALPEEGRDESRPGSQECLRHENRLDSRVLDGVISNFGALNCMKDLAAVAREFGTVVRPGGHVALCVIGRFCAWETIYYGARCNFRKAGRRWNGRAGDVYYPTIRQLRADFGRDFELLHWTGIGMLVPPSYVKLPARIVNLLARFDRLPFLRSAADHRLLIFKRK